MHDDGSFTIADTNNYRIRRVDSDGRILTVAGRVDMPDMGAFASARLPAATAMARFGDAYLVAGGSSGRAFLADVAGGQVSSVVGEPGGYEDGSDPRFSPSKTVTAAIARLLRDASGIAWDAVSNMAFISRRSGSSMKAPRRRSRDPSTWTIET